MLEFLERASESVAVSAQGSSGPYNGTVREGEW